MLREPKKRVALSRAATACALLLLALAPTAGAGASPEADLWLEVDAAAATSNWVRNSSGEFADVTIIALRPSVGIPTLKVRICLNLFSDCQAYVHELMADEYYHSPTNNVSRITATVEGLGLVDLDNYSESFDHGGDFLLAYGGYDTSLIYIQGVYELGARVASGFVGFGGTVGPWVVQGGRAINALDVSLVSWTKR